MDPMEVARLVKKLTLSTEANQPLVTVSATAVQESVNCLKRCLVGKVFSSKAPNRDTLIVQVSEILQIRGTVIIEVVGDNMFIAEFSSSLDRTRVLRDGLWHVFNSFMAFQEPRDLQNPSDITFVDLTVWVQLHNLPFLYMHSSIVSEIAGQIGIVHEVDLGIDGSCMGKYARARVTISLAKPLQRCVNASLEKGDKPTLILLIYERLPDFCYACGKSGHVLRECEDESVNKSELEYGPWLRAGRAEVVRSRAQNKNMARDNRGFQNRDIPIGEFSSKMTNSQRTIGLVLEQDNLLASMKLLGSKARTKTSQLKPIAERELDDGPNLSIVAVDSVRFPACDSKVGSKALVDEGVDVAMETLGIADMTNLVKKEWVVQYLH